MAEWPSFPTKMRLDDARWWSAYVDAPGPTPGECTYRINLFQAGELVSTVVELVRVDGEQKVIDAVAAAAAKARTEAELLRERVAKGLSPVRLEVAALCGAPAAREALATLPHTFVPVALAQELKLDFEKLVGCPRREGELELLGLFDAWRKHALFVLTPPLRVTIRLLHLIDPAAATCAMYAAFRALTARLPKPEHDLAPLLDAVGAWLELASGTTAEAVAKAAAALPRGVPGRFTPDHVAAARSLARAISEPGTVEPLLVCLGRCVDWSSRHDQAFEFSALEEILLPPAQAAVIRRALGYDVRPPTVTGAPRFKLVESTRDHGDVYELEHDTTWHVVDTRTQKTVMQFSGTASAKLGDHGSWEFYASDGVSKVELDADQRHVIADGVRHEIPGADAPPPKPLSKKKPLGKKKRPPTGPPCPRCDSNDEVEQLGTEVLEGSLEYHYLVHTELEETYRCDRCDLQFSHTRYL